MRATYGGISLGLAVFWGWCARGRNTQHAGLLSSLLVLSAAAFGRLIGMIVDGSPNVFMFVLFAAEVLFAALIFAALKKAETK